MEAGQPGRFAGDAAKFGSAMNSIAHSQAMVAAIKDYSKEMEAGQATQGHGIAALNVNELLDDKELQKLHEERIARMKSDHEKRSVMQRQGHGEVQEITEGEFLEVVTQTDRVVCHFFHRDFERCKIMDVHLGVLARRYFKTRFIKISAPDAPFFTVKLNIKMLPCVIMFRHGQAVGQVVGFEGLGATDDFETSALEDQFLQAEVVEEPEFDIAADDDKLDASNGTIRRGFAQTARTASDEGSDFDE
mmetsp:Transcript_8627/g.14834  ORF Transcript_8627/g.14834 Transcript_8627/m.14834 type:complete len:247 (+) Transcript_8627:66-806(+)|eukprot:CAMPEP_0119104456 /NCGR_PEP_ID=MMETSP1180-20130426/2667_1 /TAXON_ID=3052 ORGANISM="Chlamydomonas cf sp, Strain CCMP681" /NCGR_SAMPLE_ID=MMETSP1180 /ASSEMBLY_ACC=CAM_ASM_000741 /LENGTH=246 /DNA_ID=CAMNT_0007089221 /DNA_START=66 /DNA_END=806 /DNA_ORIENTATION=-